MVKDMIQKLMEEANEEAEHKGFCDTEMTTNKQTRDAKTEESAELQATIDKATADIQKLADEIATINDEIADIDAAAPKEPLEAEGPIKYDLRALTILKKAGGGAFVQQGAKPETATQAKATNTTAVHKQDNAKSQAKTS